MLPPPLLDSPRRLAIAVALVLALAWLSSGPGAGVGAPARVAAQSTPSCTVRVSRSYPSLEGRGRARWDERVDVLIDVTADCSGASPMPQFIEVRDLLPAGLSFAAAGPLPPEDLRDGQPLWRIPVPAVGTDAGIADSSLDYTLVARPRDLPLDPGDELRLEWPTRVRALRGSDAELLPVSRQMALPVLVTRADNGCRLEATREFSPVPVAPGAPVTVTLGLQAVDCRTATPRLYGTVVLQPLRRSENLTRTTTVVHQLFREIEPSHGSLGLLINSLRRPTAVPPSTDASDILPTVRAMTIDPEGGGDARAALRRGLDQLAVPPLHHPLLLYVAHGDAPRAQPELVADLVAEAAVRGVELVPICIGGGCDPALTWRYDYPDLRTLFFRIRAGLLDPHRGQPLELAAVDVSEQLPPGTEYEEGSAAGPGTADYDVRARTLRWDEVPLAPGGRVALRYRLRSPTEGGPRFTGEGAARLRYGTGETARLSQPLRLPRALLALDAPRYAPETPACEPDPSKAPWQPSVLLGEQVDMSLELTATCPNLLRDSDVILAMDVSGSMDARKLTDVQEAARSLLNLAESPRVHVGVVTFNQFLRSRLPLSGDYRAAQAAIDLMGFPLGRGEGTTNVALALRAARLELQYRRAHAEAFVVLMSDGRSDAVAMQREAAALEADGAVVITVCFGGDCPPALADTATEARFYYEVLTAEALDELFEELGLRFRQLTIQSAEVVDELPEPMPLVAGSVAPNATISPDRRTLTWTLPRDLLPFRAALTYRLAPRDVGPDQPTNLRAELAFVDELGREGTAPFPLPSVTVYDPAAFGPCRAVLDRAPTRSTAVLDSLVTTTLRAALDCPSQVPRLEVVLALDHSASMGAAGRLDGAVEAARAFLDVLDPAETRVGLVAFNESVTRRLPLDEDYADVRAALDGLRPEGQTGITAALRAAEALLAARRPDSASVILLLTDGREAAGAAAAMLDAAGEIKAAGTQIVTVCAGDCDPELAAVASGPDSAFDVGEAAQLRALFQDLARRFSLPDPRAVRVVDAYPRAMKMIVDAYAPTPEAFVEAEAVWEVGRLGEGEEVALAAAGRPQLPGEVSVSRFARLEYAYGFPPRQGAAYFPTAVLDVITPTPTATPTPEPTWTPSVTPTVGPTSTGTPPRPGPSTTPGPGAGPSATARPGEGRSTVWLPWAWTGEGLGEGDGDRVWDGDSVAP